MRDLRIVFMGTPEFAVTSLEHLLQAGYAIAGVVTAPDKPAGRGRKLQQSAVKEFALRHHLPVLQPANLKSDAFLNQLSKLNANLQIVVAFRMLPKEVWNMPQYGTFNLHASLLPQYRGAAPINWAIINGENKTGVTTFFIDDKIDTGAILLQESLPIGPHETAGELHDRLMTAGARLVVETTRQIAEAKAVAKVQNAVSGLKQAPKIHKETCRISWEMPLSEIYNHIRGLSPYPAAWTVLLNAGEEQELKIYTARPIPAEHDLAPGSIRATKHELKVAAPGGFIELLEVQLAGKRRLDIKAVLNGLQVSENAHML